MSNYSETKVLKTINYPGEKPTKEDMEEWLKSSPYSCFQEDKSLKELVQQSIDEDPKNPLYEASNHIIKMYEGVEGRIKLKKDIEELRLKKEKLPISFTKREETRYRLLMKLMKQKERMNL